MGIPTLADFREWLNLVGKPLDLSEFIPEDPDQITRDVVAKFMMARASLNRERRNAALGLTVGKWILTTREFARAERLVFRSGDRRRRREHPETPSTTESALDRFYATAERRVALRPSSNSLAQVLQDKMMDQQQEPVSGRWAFVCIHAIYEYFDESTPKRMVHAYRQLGPAAQAAQAAIAAYIKAVDDVNSLLLPDDLRTLRPSVKLFAKNMVGALQDDLNRPGFRGGPLG